MRASERTMKLKVCMIKSLSPYSTKLYQKKKTLVCCCWHCYSCCEKQSGEQISWVLCTQPSHLALSVTLAVRYQLVQSILKVGFALADKRSWVGIFKTCCACGGCLGWLYNSLGWHWLDHFSPCKHKLAQKPFLSSFRGTNSRSVGIFQSVSVH